MKRIYLLLAVAGAVIPYLLFLRFIGGNGFAPQLIAQSLFEKFGSTII